MSQIILWLTLWLLGREVWGSHPGHRPTAILLGSNNLWQVIYSHCLPSLLSSKKLRYKRQYSDWTDSTACVANSFKAYVL